MARFHLALAADFLSPFPQDLSFHSRGVCVAANMFKSNLLRIQSLGRLPTMMAGAAKVWQTFEMLARKKLEIDSPLPVIPETDLPPSGHISKELLRVHLNRQWFALSQKMETLGGMQIGEMAISQMAPVGGDEIAEGIEAVLIGMLTGTWTAYEVLVEDLWKSVVLEFPFLKKRITEDEWKCAGLRSLRKARNLYKFTLRYDTDAILHCLSDQNLDALALTRNLIVHCGGKVDKGFEKGRKKIAQLNCFSHIQRDQRIPVDGQIVRDLILPICPVGLGLAKAVDEWLYYRQWPPCCLF